MLLSMSSFRQCIVRSFSLFLGMMLCAACIKEDREDCPCRLIVDLTDVDSTQVAFVDILLAGNDGLLYEGARSSVTYKSDEVILIPRQDVFLNVCSGDGEMMGEDGLVIPEGMDCPPVYMYSTLVEAEGRELVRKSVQMRKNHCVMKIYLEEDREGLPFNMVLKGNVSGYNASGAPRLGLFRCSPHPVGDSAYTVILPRQVDSSLILEVDDGTQVLKTFAIGEYVRACGYDWTEADLKDITLGIDYARTQILIEVNGWDEVYEFDIVI